MRSSKSRNVGNIIESEHHASTGLIAQEINDVQKTPWNHLKKAGYTEKLYVRAPRELTKKTS